MVTWTPRTLITRTFTKVPIDPLLWPHRPQLLALALPDHMYTMAQVLARGYRDPGR